MNGPSLRPDRGKIRISEDPAGRALPSEEDREKASLVMRLQERLQQQLEAQCSAAMQYMQTAQQSTDGYQLTASHKADPEDSFLEQESKHVEHEQMHLEPDLMNCPCGKTATNNMTSCAKCGLFFHLWCVPKQLSEGESFVCNLCFLATRYEQRMALTDSCFAASPVTCSQEFVQSPLRGDGRNTGNENSNGCTESVATAADRRVTQPTGSEQGLHSDGREPGNGGDASHAENENSARCYTESAAAATDRRANGPPGSDQSPLRGDDRESGNGGGVVCHKESDVIAGNDKGAPSLCDVCERPKNDLTLPSECTRSSHLLHSDRWGSEPGWGNELRQALSELEDRLRAEIKQEIFCTNNEFRTGLV